jgi:hypothetical protein
MIKWLMFGKLLMEKRSDYSPLSQECRAPDATDRSTPPFDKSEADA